MQRRAFMAAGAAALTARAYSQVRGANERLRWGLIGCGVQGTHHLGSILKMAESDNVEVAAVCDVFDKRAEQAGALAPGAKRYRDYRRMLERKDLDYVTVATPDHAHGRLALAALEAGKHVYIEKPMTHTVEEAKQVVAAAARTGRKVQVGVQSMSDDSYETAYRYVQEGALGKVVMAQIDYSRNYRGDDFWLKPVDPDLRPGKNFDWDLFLGPAPQRPFDPDRYFQWIRYWDYSGGVPTGLLVHRVTRIIKALGLTVPESGSAHGGKFQFTGSRAEIPDTVNVMLDYPGGPTVLLVSSLANDTAIEHTLRGHKATLHFHANGFTIWPQKVWAGEVKEIVHQRTGAEDVRLHHRNLMNAIRLGEPLKCDATLGYYGTVAGQFGVKSYRARKYMVWDREKQDIVAS
ncbi:MAG TPA: Gfo/Idh/MocA family oxidoreductase [Bryobacteraceae bacterium]|nr:Gfo/Idh/MocA family oxidoreductase [Bryobacteraceae bacterium]